MDLDPVADAALAHELLVQVDPQPAVVRPHVGDADDRAVAELPQMLERQRRAGDAVAVDAGDLAARGPVGDAEDVAVLLGEHVERRSAPSMSPMTMMPSACDRSNIEP